MRKITWLFLEDIRRFATLHPGENVTVHGGEVEPRSRGRPSTEELKVGKLEMQSAKKLQSKSRTEE
eukprot:scaffold26047_cov162-Cylindrotheca_fusiformis.AAC.1